MRWACVECAVASLIVSGAAMRNTPPMPRRAVMFSTAQLGAPAGDRGSGLRRGLLRRLVRDDLQADEKATSATVAHALAAVAQVAR